MTSQQVSNSHEKGRKKQTIKCVVWDLDNTLWNGVLLEDKAVTIRNEVVEIIKVLDQRGILNSIASKNEHAMAMQVLEQHGLSQYFLCPQINWNSKSSSISEIAKLINIGIDTLAFVDDQPFEREEVAFNLPQVLCLDALEITDLLAMPEVMPRFITEDSARRREMYLSDITRNQAEKAFIGPSAEFLATLNMVFTIATATEDDLKRAEELTVRTHQLNTTGYTYSYEELSEFIRSPHYNLLISSLDDTYGTYGKIGLTLVECQEGAWTIKLLLMSCRVMSRGVGNIMVNHILQMAKAAGVRLYAEFVTTDRNRMMYVTYKLGGFREVKRDGNVILFEHDLSMIQPFPQYVDVRIV